MSHFEYISVAVALINALLISRLLNGFPAAFSEQARYPIHYAWVITLTLVAVLQWWVFWRTSTVTWSPVRFLWALALPSVVFLRASILLGTRPEEVVSFKEHFFQYRVRFFSLGILTAVMIILSPWVFGIAPWFETTSVHTMGAILLTLSLSGVVFKGVRSHQVIVSLNLLNVVSGFFLVPIAE